MTTTTTQHSTSSNKLILSALFQRLYGIEAIDKFVAEEFANLPELNADEVELWGALLVTLSFMQRNGHSCLSLAELADKRMFDEPEATVDNAQQQKLNATDDAVEEESQERLKGIVFPSLTQLIKCVKNALENQTVAQLFVYQEGRLYSRRYFDFEREVASSIVQRTALEVLDETATTRVKALWPQMFPTSEVLQQDWQQVAVAKSIVQRFSVINGGPGTGKTYTVLRLLLALQAVDENINIVLAAPTGKAQQRMTESIVSNIEGLRGSVPEETLQKVPTDAVTIHRLLGLREHTIATKFGTSNTLNLDVLIVDEASMVDLALMARIMRALPEHARLYFIGDADQLPAVELGNVLEQLVEGNATSKLELVGSDDSDQLNGKALSETEFSGTELMGAVPTDMRQHIVSLCPHLPLLPVNENAKTWVSTLQAPQRFKGQVAEVATAIQQGDALKALSSLTPKNVLSNKAQLLLTEGVHLMPEGVNNSELLKQLAKESFTDLFAPPPKENGLPFGPADALALLNAVRWLTPMRKGPMGVEGLNALVFDAIKHKIKRREGQFYQGQPIMIVKNHHPQRLSNGEVGVIWPDKSGKLQAWFEAPESGVENGAERGVRHISLSRLPQFETVFAMTIHKSQGSEFKHVVLILSDAPSDKAANLLHRGLVYTGLTRAKKGCLILAKQHTFTTMIEKVDKRFSGLSQTIKMLEANRQG